MAVQSGASSCSSPSFFSLLLFQYSQKNFIQSHFPHINSTEQIELSFWPDTGYFTLQIPSRLNETCHLARPWLTFQWKIFVIQARKKKKWRLPPLDHLFSSSVNIKNMEEIYEKQRNHQRQTGSLKRPDRTVRKVHKEFYGKWEIQNLSFQYGKVPQLLP